MAAIALGSRIAVSVSPSIADGEPLQPVKENGLVNVRKAVEQGNHPIARAQHLARQLCVVRFVRIHQRRRAEFPEHHDPADSRPLGQTEPIVGSENRFSKEAHVISLLSTFTQVE